MMQSTFAEAVCLFPDECADLIYLDGYAHTGQEGGQTLRDWWPKLKPGGIFAGHDYDPQHYPQTVAAVDAFVLEHRLELHTIQENPHPSWWLRKPRPTCPLCGRELTWVPARDYKGWVCMDTPCCSYRSETPPP